MNHSSFNWMPKVTLIFDKYVRGLIVYNLKCFVNRSFVIISHAIFLLRDFDEIGAVNG